MKLSIIIPVYRAEDTLERCIGSILQQSFTSYELILVDDGSPDACPLLCDEYAGKDSHIHVIHKENGGLSDARNVGIKRAKGLYITFIDSDDAIEENSLQQLMEELYQHPDVDILEYPIMERISHPHREKLLSFAPKTYQNAIEYWLAEKGYHHTYACNKIFRRSLFQNIEFPKGKSFEDVWTIPKLIGLTEAEITTDRAMITPDKKVVPPPPLKIRVTDVGKYLYYWNPQGMTSQAKYPDLLQLYLGQRQALMKLKIAGKEKMKLQMGATEKPKLQMGATEEILLKYQSSLEDFLTQHLNVLLDLYDLSGRYEPDPPLIHAVKWLEGKTGIHSFKLKLFNILGYHSLCKINHLIHRIYRHP